MTPPSPSGAPTPQATESLTVAAPNIPADSAHLAERIAEEQQAYLHAFDTLMAEFLPASASCSRAFLLRLYPCWRLSSPSPPAASACAPC